MRKVLFWLSVCMLSAVLIGNFVADNASYVMMPIDDSRKECPICYECSAYLNGDVFYADRLYTSGANKHIISNMKDAQERFEHMLEYGEGQFKYHRIVCNCSTVQANDYTDHLYEVKDKSDTRYERYLRHKQILTNTKNTNYEQVQKNPSL